jgi:hypothetical protein
VAWQLKQGMMTDTELGFISQSFNNIIQSYDQQKVKGSTLGRTAMNDGFAGLKALRNAQSTYIQQKKQLIEETSEQRIYQFRVSERHPSAAAALHPSQDNMPGSAEREANSCWSGAKSTPIYKKSCTPFLPT